MKQKGNKMRKEEFKFKSSNGTDEIRTVRYIPDGEVKAVLQIAHGMVEFIDRYENFANFLCDRGYLVTGNDHIGHGGSVKSQDDWGYLGEDGNKHILEDMHILTGITKEAYPDKPYYLLGHSMGSFFARDYIGTYGSELDGAIIMGTGMQNKATLNAGLAMTKTIATFKGWRYRSAMVNNISLGAYNKPFEPARTPCDWLSKDEEIVDKYCAEPRNQFVFTVNGYYYLFKELMRLTSEELIDNIPKDLPILFVSGAEDPVGEATKTVVPIIESFKAHGIKDVKYKFYENDRHEILNETDKDVVYNDIYNWLETKEI